MGSPEDSWTLGPRAVHEPARRRGELILPQPMERPIRVLIADDEASQRSGLASLVSAWGMVAETAADGNEALTKLADFPADVILTDLNMPGMDGFGLLGRAARFRRHAPGNCADGFRKYRNRGEDRPRVGRLLVSGKAHPARRAGDAGAPRGQHAGLSAEKRNLERQLGYKGSLGELVGASARMQEIFALAAAGRAQQGLRADHRRKRRREGTGGARAAPLSARGGRGRLSPSTARRCRKR